MKYFDYVEVVYISLLYLICFRFSKKATIIIESILNLSINLLVTVLAAVLAQGSSAFVRTTINLAENYLNYVCR